MGISVEVAESVVRADGASASFTVPSPSLVYLSVSVLHEYYRHQMACHSAGFSGLRPIVTIMVAPSKLMALAQHLETQLKSFFPQKYSPR